MNINKLLTDLILDIDDSNIRLSLILNKCLRVALYYEDIEEILWIQMNSINLKDSNKGKDDYLISLILSKLDIEQFNVIKSKVSSDFIRIRSIRSVDELINDKEPKNIISIPVYLMENEIENLNDKQIELDRSENISLNDRTLIRKKLQESKIQMLHGLSEYRSVLSKIRNHEYQYLVRKEKELQIVQGEKNSNIIQSKNIFIIHGQNEAKWRELKTILKDDLDLNPIILQEQANRGKTIIEKFEFYASSCSYAFAIFTPDDVIDNDGEKYFQARPNVIFELGWFCSYLTRRNVCIIFQEGANMSIFSDFQGVIQKRFHRNISELYKEITNELSVAEIIGNNLTKAST